MLSNVALASGFLWMYLYRLIKVFTRAVSFAAEPKQELLKQNKSIRAVIVRIKMLFSIYPGLE